jgi:hypothetical protein
MRSRVLQPVSRGEKRQAPSPVTPRTHAPRQAEPPASAYLPRPSLLHGHEAAETYGIDSRLFAPAGRRPMSARADAANRLGRYAVAPAPPIQTMRDHTPAAPAVVQRWPKSIPGWARRTLTGAAGLIGGAAGFFLTPGTLPQRVGAAATTGLAGAALAHRLLPPATTPANTFSQQLRGQRDFHRDIDRRLNHQASFEPDPQYPDEESMLRVPSRNVTHVAERLRNREAEQRRLVGPINEAGGDIFDDTIQHHDAKNQLWRDWTARAAAGTTKNVPADMPGQASGSASSQADGHQRNAVDRDFRDRTATTLARIIGTESGAALMHHVHTQANNLGIPIHFVEDEANAKFNLSVDAGMNEHRTALQHLTVNVPAAGKYNDAQSFKRSHADGDVRRMGGALTAAPLDTDMFHEFVHAAHYLAMERRRRAAAASDEPETFARDYEAYQHGVGGQQPVLSAQDKVSEASTIHRSSSLNDLQGLLEHNAERAVQDSERPDQSASAAGAMRHIDRIAQHAHIPAENTYREEIGLQPRQDHRALRLSQDGEYEYGALGHRIVLT